jgi:hypothetical protein
MNARAGRRMLGAMKTLIVYESMYGNTHAVADAVAEGLGGNGDVQVRPVHTAGDLPLDLDLLIVGGPTHMHGLATSMSRSMAVTAAKEDAGKVEPGATGHPGLREWLRGLEVPHGTRAAAFDTRAEGRVALTGSAARGIAKRLRHRGLDVIDSASFLVADAEGPLEDGELERARAWGERLAG